MKNIKTFVFPKSGSKSKQSPTRERSSTTMSWWAQKIADTLRLDDDDQDEDEEDNLHNHNQSPENPKSAGDDHRGVKEDLSELTKTLSRQFWGVASFLAPPPSDQTTEAAAGPSDAAAGGIRSDLAEIGGKFRSGISKLSDNIVRTDFTKIASDLLQLGVVEERDEVAVGVTEEVVAFARDIAMHPETWLDFPLPSDDDEDEEFEMSDAQQEHALAVERLAPRLAALRIELCPGYMSESCFWMIYFVLLHPRLDKHDAELLSAPEIVKARGMLTQEMQNRAVPNLEQNQPITESYYSGDTSAMPHEKQSFVSPNSQFESIPLEAVPAEPNSSILNDKFATDKHPILSSELPIIDKSVTEEHPINKPSSSSKVDENFEDEADDWLKEESLDTHGAGTSTIPIENDEDVSFSDLEEDDADASTSYKKAAYGSDSSTRESRDWVQLGRSSTDSTKDINTVGTEQVSAPNSESKESSDWLDLEEIDVE